MVKLRCINGCRTNVVSPDFTHNQIEWLNAHCADGFYTHYAKVEVCECCGQELSVDDC